MKRTFLISSPCYKANGLHGTYYSIAITDDEGNVIKGFGDHISSNSYGIKNVFESEGASFSDEDRFITIREVTVSDSDLDDFIKSYQDYCAALLKKDEERVRLFTADIYKYIYGTKSGQEERLREYSEWNKKNTIKEENYYGFLDLIDEL